MTSILLTGATGFLGSHLLATILNETKYDVVVLKRSFSRTVRINKLMNSNRVKVYDIDFIKINSVFNENNIEIIIHCATNYGRDNSDIPTIVESNLMLPLELLHLSIKYNVKCFINTDTIIDKNISHYSLSKSQFVDWLLIYSNKIKCINLRLEHFYGANDNDTKFTTMIFKALINNNKEINLTNGEQKRHFVYIDDVVSAFLCVIKNIYKIEGNYNYFDIGNRESVRIKDFILYVREIVGNNVTNLNFGAIPYRKNEIMDIPIDIDNLIKLGWSPKVELLQGIKLTISKELELL